MALVCWHGGPTQNLGVQLTLFQLGGQIMLTTFLRIWKPNGTQSVFFDDFVWLLRFLLPIPMHIFFWFCPSQIICLVGSTNQACSSSFYFRIAWKSTEWPCFLQNHSLSFLQGLRSLKNWLLQKLSIKSLDQKGGQLDYTCRAICAGENEIVKIKFCNYFFSINFFFLNL